MNEEEKEASDSFHIQQTVDASTEQIESVNSDTNDNLAADQTIKDDDESEKPDQFTNINLANSDDDKLKEHEEASTASDQMPKLEITADGASLDPMTQPVALRIESKAPSLSSLSLNDQMSESTHEANAHVAYEQEIDRLRELISQKEIENSNLETKLNDYQQQSKQQIEQLHANFTARLEQTLKKFQDIQKDKTSSMVMKYAEAEKRCIDLNRNIELLQSKLVDSNKEKQRINERLESAKSEAQKLNAEYEKKLQEIMNNKKENDKLKEIIVLAEAREKAAILKLKNEIDAHNNTKNLLESSISEQRHLKETNQASGLKESSSGTQLSSLQNEEASEESKAANGTELDATKSTNQMVSSTLSITSSASTDDVLASNKIDENQNEIKKARSNENVSNTASNDQKKNSLQVTMSQADRLQRDRTTRELYALKSQLKDMFEERTTLKDRIQCLEQERKLQETSFLKYKETLQSQKQMNKDLLNEILQLREAQETLFKEQIEKKNLSEKLELLTVEFNDLQNELDSSKEKQNELLSFTSKLTEKITQLQSDKTLLSDKLQQVQDDLQIKTSLLETANDSSKAEIQALSEKLSELQKMNQTISEELAEKQKQFDELSTKLADEQDENAAIKKKHAANIKDLTRQLQILQKKVESGTPSTVSSSSQINPFKTPDMPTSHHPSHDHIYKTTSISEHNISSFISSSSISSSAPSASQHGKSTSSRTNSISSLNDKESVNNVEHVNRIERGSRSSIESTPTSMVSSATGTNLNRFNEVICGNEDVYVVDVDKQKIIDKIVKLQKMLARRNEKIDFLQDHVTQLTNDVKRKTKIIQAYAMNEDVGAFTSEAHDAIKREMSNKTGIMSALYQNNASYLQTAQFINSNESNMTKELCLEINSKLQALLEDTLIKNITLKDSLETLGQEIARLSKENRQLKVN